MKNLIIVGAGGLGREVYWIAHEPKDASSFVIKGFLDDRPIDLEKKGIQHPILSAPETYKPQADDVFLVAMSDPLQKTKYTALLAKKNAPMHTVAHRTALVFDGHLTQGSVFFPHCAISRNVDFGIGVTIDSFVNMGHDTVIGDYTHIGSLSFIAGNVQIGHSCVIHPHATILPGIKIGNHCVVGAGSVVIKNVSDGQTVFGNPALPVKWQAAPV